MEERNDKRDTVDSLDWRIGLIMPAFLMAKCIGGWLTK
jgi:hypothetical protein